MKDVPKWLSYGLCIIVALLIVFLVLRVLSTGWTRPKDAQIIRALSEARTVMTYLHYTEGNYDNFNCQQKDMKKLCEGIDKNYEAESMNKPIISLVALNNSQAACIYSPLNVRDNYWYCVDSSGNAVFTEINPGSTGYCVNGESAFCPPYSD